MSIFSRLNETKQQAQQSTVAKYIALLQGMDINDPTPAQENRLVKFLEELGKTPEQSEKDHKRVQDVAYLGELAATFDERKADYHKASKAHGDLCAKHQKLNKKMQADMKVANGNKQNARSQWDRTIDAKRKLESIDLANELSPKEKTHSFGL